MKLVCGICGKEVDEKDIHGFFPEDSTYICKDCFGKQAAVRER